MIFRPTLLLATLCIAAATGSWCAPVNINSADAATLAQELKGIGNVKARAIVEYRLKHGAFRSVDELAQVKGISQKLIDRNRTDLRVDRQVPAAAAPARAAAKPVPRG
jgi:competence protein ComEA